MQISDKKLLAILLTGNGEDPGSATPLFGDALRPSHLNMATSAIDWKPKRRISIGGTLTPFFQITAGMVYADHRQTGWIVGAPTGKLDTRQAADLSIPQA